MKRMLAQTKEEITSFVIKINHLRFLQANNHLNCDLPCLSNLIHYVSGYIAPANNSDLISRPKPHTTTSGHQNSSKIMAVETPSLLPWETIGLHV
jgi:hypothetical protein